MHSDKSGNNKLEHLRLMTSFCHPRWNVQAYYLHSLTESGMPNLNSITDDIISHVRADATKKNLVPVVLFASNLLQVEIALASQQFTPNPSHLTPTSWTEFGVWR